MLVHSVRNPENTVQAVTAARSLVLPIQPLLQGLGLSVTLQAVALLMWS